MVVDVGTVFLKYSLFTNYNGMTDYLIRSEIKYMNEIFAEGEFNYNLLSRDMSRKVDEFREFGEIDLLIILSPRNLNEGKIIPRFEYRENYKEFKDKIKAEYKDIEKVGNVYDWVVTEDNPAEDYQSIIIDSIPDDFVLEVNKIVVNLKVKEFIVTSPLLGYMELMEHDGQAHAILDIGHTKTRVAVVKDGIMYGYQDTSLSGADVTQVLERNHKSTYEAMMYKHNNKLAEFPIEIDSILNEIKDLINDEVERYANSQNDLVVDFCIIGGTANLELEEEFNKQTIGIDRVFPELRLDNDILLPNESRNYLYASYGIYKYILKHMGNKEEIMDFSASKSGGIGIKVKQISNTFKKVRTPLIAGLVGMYATIGIVAYSSLNAGEYINEVSASEMNYNNRLAALQGQHESTKQEYQELMSAPGQVDEGKDTGMLLDQLNKITPPKFNIKELKMERDGNRAILIVKSESQIMVSSFITLLQDPEQGIYHNASIFDIKLEKSQGKNHYVTTIILEGRKL